MTAVATAIIGSSVIGAASSKSAANQQVKAQREGLAQSNVLQNRAITQAKDYFNLGQKSAQAGYQSALDLFKSSQASKYQPMIQGNVAAQRMIGLGATQANNAILGLPVDMSFANNPQAITPDFSAIQNAQLPPSIALQQAQQQANRAPDQDMQDQYVPGNYIDGLGRVTSVTQGVAPPSTTITNGNWNGLGLRNR